MGDRLAGKTAIVTGGARGSGAEIAQRFAEEGAAVVIADVLDEQGETTAASIGTAARYVHCDVTSENDWSALVESIDTINVLVNNAAVFVLRSIAKHFPIGRRGRMRDVADAALFLASDESGFVTGTDLVVDGGISAGMIIPGAFGT
jgi:NAD(P)-dependent dehydrogenase (short-subunit alcohol dehydrogenase family)